MALTKDQIRERLKYVQKDITGTRADYFAAAISERIKRNILGILISGDGTARTITFEKKTEAAAYESIFKSVQIPATGNVWLPVDSNYSLEDPILVLEGGTNIAGTASAGTLPTTIIYYDDEL